MTGARHRKCSFELVFLAHCDTPIKIKRVQNFIFKLYLILIIQRVIEESLNEVFRFFFFGYLR
ncbi:unnamed protein product, partial [Vitis vinifera]